MLQESLKFPKGKIHCLLHSLHARKDSRLGRWRRLPPMELRLPQLPLAARRDFPRKSAHTSSGRYQRRLRALVSPWGLS